MKRWKLQWLWVICCISSLKAQESAKKMYTTTSGEWIFSMATVEDKGKEESTVLRFAPFFNIQNWVHIDRGPHFGFFTGMSIRNVGFIYNIPDSTIKKKFRTYNIGIPIGIKLGNMRKTCLFGGYEIEFPINYKEKTFENERRIDRFDVWFSKRVPAVYHSVMLGIQFPRGTSIKFKYYLTEFFNTGYSGIDGAGKIYKPFENLHVHVFYFSLNFNLLHNRRLARNKPKVKETSDKVQYSFLF